MRSVVLSLIALAAGSVAARAAEQVSFNRDIRPIMSDTCFHCHGFDAKSRKAGLRLDLREEALKPTKNGVIPIVPGKPDESEIVLRIADKDDPMPPEEAHKTLTPAQKDLFRRWVAEGAHYEPHWAYTALDRPSLPSGQPIDRRNSKTADAQNPVDAFVHAKLSEKKIAPSPAADPARLMRRLSLDLTGLPPTPAEAAAFLADARPGAYGRQVERLLASPRHGERMAVWWLDVARYADTVGFHGDQNQRSFPYRDYVIGAFNTNKRFDQFTREQLAGDLLPAPTPEQLVATGYNRLNMMTREGGAQAKEYLAKYGAERVRSVAAAWFGSTFGCAECHDHKFDPIKARDFYELQSFFADVKQWGVYSDYQYTPNPELKGFNNDYPFPPEVEVESAYLRARRDRLAAELTAVRATVPAAQLEAWVAEARTYLETNPSGWSEPPVRTAAPKPESPAKAATAKKARAGSEPPSITIAPAPGRLATLRLEFSPTGDSATPALLRLAAHLRRAGAKEEKLEIAFADSAAKEPRYEGGSEVIGIATGWKIPRSGPAAAVSGVWQLAVPRLLVAGDEIVLTLTGGVPPGLRVFTSPLAATDPLATASAEVLAAVRADPAHRTPAQRDRLADAAILGHAADRPTLERAQHLAARIRETRDGRAWSLVTQAVAQPIDVRVLPRGNWQDESGPIVLPATPSFLPGRRESTGEKRLTRLDLAEWIVSKANPITARTVVNRLWSMFFGTGLSGVIDDLGSQGELPSHPELLDWLAVEFRESGWDLRHIMRLIVTSETYRQSSSLRRELREADPGNRLLASQNPRRLEAEFVRDNALFAAGLLNLRDVGGPSVKPYQPPGYYAALQFPDRVYVAEDDDEQWRRGVYMHWQRTFLHPMLANFDAPSRDECAAARTVSNTPQQALTLLNDPTFVEAARHLAARAIAAGTTDAARLSAAFQRALGRDPRVAERDSLLKLLAAQREIYRAAPADADKLLRIGLSAPPVGDPIEHAAWTQVARVIVNLQEFITRY
ncbi:MAG: PSD1 and planctomycete cytochrome C domain-containing protein [Opitutaceae bacterium]|nr:PSD1 and planctomycete cytochrome C domain-containing protein [Opitutaceae bacterium]